MKRIGIFALIAAFTIGLIGCSKEPPFIAENVVSNAVIAAINPVTSYSAEIELKSIGPDDEVKEYIIKEWVSEDGKRRTEAKLKDGGEESITVYTGSQYITYLPSMKQVMLYKDDNRLTEFNLFSTRNQTVQLLAEVHDTHEIKAVGEEKLAGRDTYRVSAKAEDTESSYGDQEYWVDQEHWILLKMISHAGDNRNEMEFKKIEIEPNFDADIFRIDFPEDVVITDLDRIKPGEDDEFIDDEQDDELEDEDNAEESAEDDAK